MTSNYKKSGGRDVIVSLVEAVTTIEGDGTSSTLEIGKWYVATSKAATASAIDDFKVGRPFYARTAIVLAVDDNVVELSDFWDKDNIIGFANSKSLSFSKNSFDTTVDWDEYYDKITEPQVEVSGNFDGFKLLGITDENTAVMKVNQAFVDITVQTDAGDTVAERTNEVMYFAFVFGKEKPTVGKTIDITFTPGFLTANAESNQYSSGNTQNMSFEGSAKSTFGAVTSKSVVLYQ